MTNYNFLLQLLNTLSFRALKWPITKMLLKSGADVRDRGWVLERGDLIEVSPLELVSLWQKRIGETNELKQLKEILQAKNKDVLTKQSLKGSKL